MTTMMRPAIAAAAAAAAVAAAALAGCASVSIDPDTQFGLRRAGVFDDSVVPRPFQFDGEGAARTIAPPPGSGIPPMMSHTLQEHLPITAGANDCLQCHDKPQAIGAPVAAGKPRPAPAGHYRRQADATPVISGAYYACVACHAPQADVPALGGGAR